MDKKNAILSRTELILCRLADLFEAMILIEGFGRWGVKHAQEDEAAVSKVREVILRSPDSEEQEYLLNKLRSCAENLVPVIKNCYKTSTNEDVDFDDAYFYVVMENEVDAHLEEMFNDNMSGWDSFFNSLIKSVNQESFQPSSSTAYFNIVLERWLHYEDCNND